MNTVHCWRQWGNGKAVQACWLQRFRECLLASLPPCLLASLPPCLLASLPPRLHTLHTADWEVHARWLQVMTANRTEHTVQVSCELISIKESLAADGETHKLPPHLSILKPAPDSPGLPPMQRAESGVGSSEGKSASASKKGRNTGSTGHDMLRVTVHVPPKLAGAAAPQHAIAVVSIAVEVAPVHLVWDADVCLRLHRYTFLLLSRSAISASPPPHPSPLPPPPPPPDPARPLRLSLSYLPAPPPPSLSL